MKRGGRCEIQGLQRVRAFFGVHLNAKSGKLKPDITAGLPQRRVIHDFGIEPTENEVIVALRSMANAKEMGPDELPIELLKLELKHGNPNVLSEFHQVITLVWHQRKVPQQ